MIDIGLNLADAAFDADREDVLAVARAAGVLGAIVTGTDLEVSRRAAGFAAGQRGVLWSTAGVHPHRAADWNPDVAAGIAALLARPEVVAVGECGLDHFRMLAPAAVQARAFADQLALARRHGLPVFLHQRGAHREFIAVLREHPDLAGVAHCFTEGPAEAEDCLALGLHLGITGWLCDERRGGALRDAVRGVPRERLLVETDAPYLIPRDLPRTPGVRRGTRNEPRHLPHIVAALARLRGEDPAEVAAYTTTNARRLFALA